MVVAKSVAIFAVLTAMMSSIVFATGTIEGLGNDVGSILGQIYTTLRTLSTVAAVVAGTVAAFGYFFGKSDKTVQTSKSWGIRIAIAWCVINGIGFLVTLLGTLTAGHQWNP